MVKNFLIVLKIYSRCNKNSIEKAIRKTAETTGDLIGNKIADKITIVSLSKELYNNDETKEEEDVETATHKKRHISPEERQKIIDELRLIPKKKFVFLEIYIPPYERQKIIYKSRSAI